MTYSGDDPQPEDEADEAPDSVTLDIHDSVIDLTSPVDE